MDYLCPHCWGGWRSNLLIKHGCWADLYCVKAICPDCGAEGPWEKIPDTLLGLSKKQRMVNSQYQAFIKHVLDCFSNPIDYTRRLKEEAKHVD